MKTRSLPKLLLVPTVALFCAASSARAQVHVGVSVGLPLPPPIVISAPPLLVAFPGSYIYAAPDYGEDLFYVDGWWWRPWHGHWYRSHYYDRDWVGYSGTPYFYRSVPHDWRSEYRSGQWHGRPWRYERVGYDDVRRNWSTWKHDRHWDRADHGGHGGAVTTGRSVHRDVERNVQHGSVSRQEHGARHESQMHGSHSQGGGHAPAMRSQHPAQPASRGAGHQRSGGGHSNAHGGGGHSNPHGGGGHSNAHGGGGGHGGGHGNH